MSEVGEIGEMLNEKIKNDADIIFNTHIFETMKDEVKLIAIAFDFKKGSGDTPLALLR